MKKRRANSEARAVKADEFDFGEEVEQMISSVRRLGRAIGQLRADNLELQKMTAGEGKYTTDRLELVGRIGTLLEAIQRRDQIIDQQAAAILERDQMIAVLTGRSEHDS